MSLRGCSPIVGRCAVAVLALLTGASAHAQLMPPPGPVAPSMKRLDQLDVRKVVSSLPGSQGAVHVISTPGQYMLDRDITCPSGKSAIVVTACGSVSIDLNGFSLRGSPGALDGISRSSGCPGGGSGGGGGGGSSFRIVGMEECDDDPRPGEISGFARGIATGDLNGDGMLDIVVMGVSLRDCGQGIVHLHATGVVHRDIACRSTTAGDGITIVLDESGSITSPRQSTSVESVRVVVDRATGRGMYVSSSSGAHITINGSSFRSTGAQGLHLSSSRGTLITVRGCSFSETGSHGLHVQQSAPFVVGNDPPAASVIDCSMMSCGGAGVRFQGASGQASGKRQHGTVKIVKEWDCAVGLEATDCDDLDCDDLSISNVSSGGIVARRIGATRFSHIVLKRGVTAGAALEFEDCDDVDCVRVAVGDINGDGVSCSHSGGGGGGAGKATFKEFTLRAPRDPASGQATGKRGMVFSGLSSVECVGVSIADVDGDGVSASSCGKATFKEFTVTKKTDAASSLSHGLHLTDCDDVSCDTVRVSGCPGDGIRHVSTITSLPSRGLLYQHEAVHVVQCGGAGVRVQCPDQTCSCDVGFHGSSMNRCGGDGVVILCPSAQCSVELTAFTVQLRDCFGNGMRVSANPLSHVSVSMESSQCTGNGADGLSVRSITAGTSMRGGGEVRCSCSHFRSNGASGCVSENPLYVEKSSFSENALYGARASSSDPFAQVASLDDCVLARNGAACLSIPRGRFSTSDCSISDGLSNGVECGEGCALLTNTQVQRCAGMGVVTTSSTLYMHGGALRRNGSTGALCTGGTFTMSDVCVELNGSTAPSLTNGGGVRIVDCPVVSMERCVVSQNTGDGLSCSSASEMSSFTSSRCTFSSNTGHGMSLSNCPAVVTECVSSSNGGTGIALSSSCSRGHVCRCVCKNNFGGGLFIAGTRCVVQGNSATHSTNPTIPAMFIAQDNAACPIVFSAPGTPPSCSPTDNLVH